MKRKMIAGLCIMTLAAITITGCKKSSKSENETATNKTATIQWWTPNWDETESREMADEFMKINPDIKVNIVVTDWDSYKSRISTAISTNGAPDICSVLTTDITSFAKKDLLEPLDKLAADAGVKFDDLLKPALDIATVDGKVYGIPFRHDGSGYYYNVDLLKKAGYDSFPTTWKEYVELCKKTTSDGVYGLAYPLGNQANAVTRFVQLLYNYDGNVLNENEDKAELNSEASQKALTEIVSAMQEGYATPSSVEYDNTKMRDTFGSGKVATCISGPFDAVALRETYPDLNFKTAVIPGVDGMGYTTSNGWTLMIPKNSENKEAAAKFVAYIATPENQARLTDTFPASIEALEYDQFSTDDLKPFKEQLNNSKPEPSYEDWALMEPVIYSYIQQAITGNLSVEEACKGMDADINSIIQ